MVYCLSSGFMYAVYTSLCIHANLALFGHSKRLVRFSAFPFFIMFRCTFRTHLSHSFRRAILVQDADDDQHESEQSEQVDEMAAFVRGIDDREDRPIEG